MQLHIRGFLYYKNIVTLFNLAIGTLYIGKVPFYSTAWSNIKFVRGAINSIFYSILVKLTAGIWLYDKIIT